MCVFLYANQTKIGFAKELRFQWTGSGSIDSKDSIAIDYIEINYMSHTDRE